MGLPLIAVITAAVASVGTVVGVVTKDVLSARLSRRLSDMGPAAIEESFARMGVPLDLSNGLNDETITAAINAHLLAGTGLELASVFDRQKMLKGFESVALKRAALAFGLPEVDSVAGLRGGLEEWVGAEVVAQLGSEAGAVFDAAKPSLKITRVTLEARKNEGWNTPVNFTPEGIANRARQAKYRRSHKRTWVDKGAS